MVHVVCIPISWRVYEALYWHAGSAGLALRDIRKVVTGCNDAQLKDLGSSII